MKAQLTSNATRREGPVEDLSAIRKRLQFLLSASPAMIYTARAYADYGTTFMSENVTAQLGYEPKQFVDTPEFWADHIHPHDIQYVLAEMAELFRKGEHVFEYRFLHKDGSYRWMRDEARLVRDAEDSPLEIAGCWVDITERKQMEEALRQSEQRFVTFMNHLPGVAFIKDHDGRYLYNNPLAAAQHNTPGEWYGKTVDELFPPETAAQLKENDRRVLESGDVLQTIETTAQGGELRHWLTCKFLIPEGIGKDVLLGGVGIDITEQKRIEAELRRSELQLRRVMAERERLVQDLHDGIIQTIYAIGLNLEESARLMTEEPQQAAARVDRAIADLNGVIREVRKHLVGLEATAGSYQLCSELDNLVRTMAVSPQLRFELDVDPAAANRLTPEEANHVLYVVREAMSNSLRHSRARTGKISLKVRKPSVRLEVVDDGIGFEPQTVTVQGRGLRNMAARAERLGGKIAVRSRLGRGTRIVLHIPKKTGHDGST